jgi:TPR repeat protein
MYAQGRGVAKDEKEAVKWYRKAAEQGLASAQLNLGFMYAQGHGVTKDERVAAEWYRKAAEQGNQEAKYRLLESQRQSKMEAKNKLLESQRRSQMPASTPTTSPQNTSGKIPYAKPVPGNPGFVTSPYAPQSGFVDVRGFPRGTEVKDPYTGRIFVVP